MSEQMSDQELMTGVSTKPHKRILAAMNMLERANSPEGLISAAADTYPYVKAAIITAVREDANKIAELEARVEPLQPFKERIIKLEAQNITSNLRELKLAFENEELEAKVKESEAFKDDALTTLEYRAGRIAKLEAALNNQITDTALAEVKVEELEAENKCYAEMLDESKLVRENERHKIKRRKQRERIAELVAEKDEILSLWFEDAAPEETRWKKLYKESG